MMSSNTERTHSRYDDGFVVPSTRVPAFVQVEIRRLYRQGRSYRQIMRITGLSPCTVSRYLRPITRGTPVNIDRFW